METHNEAGRSSRAQRRARLEAIGAMVAELTGDPQAVDRLLGLVVVGLITGSDGKVEVRQAASVYGREALMVLTREVEGLLTRVTANIQAVEQAEREQRIRGRKGKRDEH